MTWRRFVLDVLLLVAAGILLSFLSDDMQEARRVANRLNAWWGWIL